MEEDGTAAMPRWMDLALTIVMALAAVGTAWAGFQSAKWSGLQAISFAEAGSARTESAKAATDAGQDRLKDLVAYTSWIGALHEEIIAGTSPRPEGDYTPDPDEVSGFLYERFRPEFRPAVDAWIATRPMVDENAPATPFEMPEYVLESETRAGELVARAEAATREAHEDNQRSDDYVFMAVILALALFFAGVANRTRTVRSQWILASAALATFLGAAVVLLVLPKTF